MKEIDFIGIGDQKSASTWIYKSIEQHPEVCQAGQKETRFFNDDYLYNQGIDIYKDFFKSCKGDKLIGEYSPSYIHSDKALKRIKKHYPNTKLVVSFRDPIQKMRSSYRYNKVAGTGIMLQYDSIREAINKRSSLLERAKHGKNLERVYNLFSPEQVFVGILDDIAEDPEQFLSKLYSFLDIDNNFVPQNINRKSKVTGNHRFKSKFLAKTMARIYDFVKSQDSLRSLLENIGAKRLQAKLQTLNKEFKEDKKEQESFEVNSKLESELRNLLEGDIKKLEKFTERDLSIWKA